MFQGTIQGWVEHSKKWDFHSNKAQMMHQRIFELFITDLMPWSTVNRPGFLRFMELTQPQFKVASEKYYRNMLDPGYEKIMAAVREKISSENPTFVAVALDGWSSFHHSYLGVIVFYLRDGTWKRERICIGCIPFDERHTAQNIFTRLKDLLFEWNLYSKTEVALRDNAANVTAAFNVAECSINSFGCMNHSLQLVIKSELFTLSSVKDLIAKCRRVAGHASQSTAFYKELYSQQERHFGKNERLSLLQDVETRWNSTYIMLERAQKLKHPLVSTLLATGSLDMEFSSQDWNLMEKLVNVLGVFYEATKALSSSDASISCVIPLVTTILKSLEVKSADFGIMGMKRGLREEMARRFAGIESKEILALATLLDPNYQIHFFRDKDALKDAKQLLCQKVVDTVRDEDLKPSETANATNETEAPAQTSCLHSLMYDIRKEKDEVHEVLAENEDNHSKALLVVSKYLTSSAPIGSSPLSFWRDYELVHSAPMEKALITLAKKYLTPPPTSTDVERLFSTSGDILSDERNRLLPSNVEKLLLCHENLPVINFKY